MTRNQMRIVLASAALLAAAPAGAQPLADGGFETGPILCEIVEQFAVWGVDGGTITPATQGITPLEGASMLRLQETAACCGRVGPANGIGADTAQLVDLTPSRTLIETGNAVATFGAWFNRVAGSANNDSQFGVIIRAFDRATLAGFRTGCLAHVAPLGERTETFLSDADPGTWEHLEVTMMLPSTTTFVIVFVSANENVRNDLVYGQEFEGHFADLATLDVRIPPPACPPDFNNDGNLDPDDLGDYINCYFSMPPCAEADFNNDGNIDPDDLGDFINAYFAGC